MVIAEALWDKILEILTCRATGVLLVCFLLSRRIRRNKTLTSLKYSYAEDDQIQPKFENFT